MKEPALAVGVLALACAMARGEPTDGIPVARFETPPAIDGRLDDDAWALAQGHHLRNIRKGALKNATSARAGYDNANLYVAFRCEEAQMQHLVTVWNHAEERDSAIWQDDCVEVFLDPLARSTETGAHIVVDSAGVWYDAWNGDRAWGCEIRTAVAKEPKAWTIEIAIPFSGIGFQPKGGETWLINLGREQKSSNELSCLGKGSGAFGNPERYVPVVFTGGGPVRVLSLADADKHAVRMRLNNPTPDAVEYRAVVRSTRGTAKISDHAETVRVSGAGTADVELPYLAKPGVQTVSLRVSRTGDGAVLYENDVQVRLPRDKPQHRVWQVPEPLYQELLSDEPTGLVRDGAIYWMPEIDHGKFWAFACQYGQRYVKAEKFDLLAGHKLRPLHNSYVLTTPAYDAFKHHRKHGNKTVLMPKTKGAKLPNNVPGTFLLDPASVDAYLDDVRRTLEQHRDVIWAVTFGDEVIDHVEASGITLFAEHAERYPFIRQVDTEVKARFGHGKFGIPGSMSDPNPFRWIAYRRWLTANLNDLLARLAATVRETAPGVHVVTDDPVALHHALDYSAMRAHADVATHQLYPRRDPTYPDFGYLTKLVADLTGITEVWPCTHVEEYAASFKPDEVLELLSQVVRNGATGYHLYLGDTVGKRKGKRCLMNEFHGAPDRWQVITAVLDEMRRTRKLRFPAPDCAILFATDTVASRPGREVSEQIPCQYTLLGPVAGCFFRFVDEYQLQRGEVDLAKYRAVYVPDAAYVRRTTVDKLRCYVSAGGRLVVTDPKAFTWYSDGTRTGSLRRELLGVTNDDAKARRTLRWRGRELPILSRSLQLSPADAVTTVVATFDDGKPAILKHELDKGACWTFASSPCSRKALANEPWKQAFTEFQAELGLQTGRDIWRFRFPSTLVKPQPLPKGRCLTNNHITWRQFVPIVGANLDTGGTYTYTVLPDNIRDQGGAGAIAFAEGDLTDRRQAPTAGDVISKRSAIQDWVARYKKPDAFDVLVDLGCERAVNRVMLYYSGPIGTLTASTSPDGQTFTIVGQQRAEEAGTRDVADIELAFDTVSARYVKLSIPERPPSSLLMLVELEIWAP